MRTGMLQRQLQHCKGDRWRFLTFPVSVMHDCVLGRSMLLWLVFFVYGPVELESVDAGGKERVSNKMPRFVKALLTKKTVRGLIESKFQGIDVSRKPTFPHVFPYHCGPSRLSAIVSPICCEFPVHSEKQFCRELAMLIPGPTSWFCRYGARKELTTSRSTSMEWSITYCRTCSSKDFARGS
jgi:hypothetical protein